MTITLPLPPSKNAYWRMAFIPKLKRPMIYKTKEAKDYSRDVYLIVKQAAGPAQSTPVFPRPVLLAVTSRVKHWVWRNFPFSRKTLESIWTCLIEPSLHLRRAS